MALNRFPGVQDSFVDADVTLLLEPGAQPDFVVIDELLVREEIEVEKVETSQEQPF